VRQYLLHVDHQALPLPAPVRQSVGRPIMFTFDLTWSCRRLRYLLWRQVCRLLVDDGRCCFCWISSPLENVTVLIFVCVFV
jgi:hypothetical protein